MLPNTKTSVPIIVPAWRGQAVVLLLLGGFVGLIFRAAYLQGIHNDFLQQKGESRYSRVLEISAHRGMLTDRHGEPLAISTPVESLWVSPEDFAATPAQLKQLATLIDMPPHEISQRAADSQRDFVYVKRHLPPEIAAKVAALNLPGLFLQREFHRYYPAGEVMAHLVGFTDVDDNGREGLELARQEHLAGKPGSRRVIKDRLGRVVEDVESLRTPKPGQDLTLSINSKIQYLAFRELKQAVLAHKAKAGGIVVLDAETGEVLALANLPVYNPNNRGNISGGQGRNRAMTDVFEPGSTLKPFTVAAALEAGSITPASIFQTAPGKLTIGNATIHDSHPEGALSVAQVIQKSSNIGAAKIALGMPPKILWEMLSRSGFGASTGSGFPGEVTGKLRPHRSWQKIEHATISYGHGISVSLLQLARSYTIFASGGELKPVSLIKLDTAVVGERVISEKTAQAVSAMLESVVQPGGTAVDAQVPGYRVAGKTGTAHKVEGNGYAEKRYVASFVGYAPASKPRLIVAVMLDEPSAGQHYGGAVAGPVFGQVMGGALNLLNVPHDAPLGARASCPQCERDARAPKGEG